MILQLGVAAPPGGLVKDFFGDRGRGDFQPDADTELLGKYETLAVKVASLQVLPLLYGGAYAINCLGAELVG